MRVLVIGASGTIGKAVVEALEGDHEVVKAAYKDGDFQVDLGSKDSIAALFAAVGPVDAVISTAGLANFGPFEKLSDEDFQLALGNKLMGQVNLVRIGREHVRDNGSITLTSGMLARQPMPGSVSISMANGALEAFSRAAAQELPRGIRVNTVSPVFVKETMEMMGVDSSHGMPASQVAQAYREAVDGNKSGETLDVRDYA
jgi:NAD(P)-dependent dehydrogenase (short-subunit alcohol dehydrogenase family)